MISNSERLDFLPEPLLRFGFDQCLDDPRTGLFAFGPLLERRPPAMRVGVIGTAASLSVYRKWVTRISGYIPPADSTSAHHLAFPGFQATFKTPWTPEPTIEIPVSETDISRALRLDDRHLAIYNTVSLFEAPIRRKLRDDDLGIDLWFVIVPEEVYLLGRPLSRVRQSERVALTTKMNARLAKRLQREPSLFEEDMQAAEIYRHDTNFHHQLKARLLDAKAVVQVVREPSLSPDNVDSLSGLKRRMQDPATLAWNLCTTSFFKAGGRPWKLAEVRDRVCYVGLVFKKNAIELDARMACCGAQMFLDSGDGLVFKGTPGPWYSPDTREFHLPEIEAKQLVERIVTAYVKENGQPPTELFIHGRTRFNDAEWRGFRDGAPSGTNVVCVRIRRSHDMKLFRDGTTPVLRGTTYRLNSRRALLWTMGYIPYLMTYPGREVPNPLSVEVVHGDADIAAVCSDVMRLTKLNFNACIYADGIPVTLRFADAVGEILTAAPLADMAPLPFRHYI